MNWISSYPKFVTVPAHTEVNGYYNNTNVAKVVMVQLPCGGSLSTDDPDEAIKMLRAQYKEQYRVSILPDTNAPMPFDLEKALHSILKVKEMKLS